MNTTFFVEDLVLNIFRAIFSKKKKKKNDGNVDKKLMLGTVNTFF